MDEDEDEDEEEGWRDGGGSWVCWDRLLLQALRRHHHHQQQTAAGAHPPPCLSRPLSSGEITIALRHLQHHSVDPDLARVIDSHQPPTFQNHFCPLHSLARSILYQQLDMKAASSIYGRFISLCGGETNVVPEAVLALTPQQLRQIGVSTRNAGYLHDLASMYCGGILYDAAIISMDDKSLFSMLTMVKGIHMLMIFSLHRPDVLSIFRLSWRPL